MTGCFPFCPPPLGAFGLVNRKEDLARDGIPCLSHAAIELPAVLFSPPIYIEVLLRYFPLPDHLMCLFLLEKMGNWDAQMPLGLSNGRTAPVCPVD